MTMFEVQLGPKQHKEYGQVRTATQRTLRISLASLLCLSCMYVVPFCRRSTTWYQSRRKKTWRKARRCVVDLLACVADIEQVVFETVELRSGQEYRFEAEWEEPLRLRLVNGTAEIFGTELAVGVEYQFRGQKAALYTWKGCAFQILARPGVSYVAEDTPMAQYLNLHFAIETIRNRYLMNPNSVYPTVLIVGPRNAGKTSLTKILTAYALKQNRIPHRCKSGSRGWPPDDTTNYVSSHIFLHA